MADMRAEADILLKGLGEELEAYRKVEAVSAEELRLVKDAELEKATAVLARKQELALLETLENGKPLAQSVSEIEAAAELWHYAAALVRHLHGDSYNTLYVAENTVFTIGLGWFFLRATGTWRKISIACTVSSRACTSVPSNAPAPCPAASSRCSPSGAD